MKLEVNNRHWEIKELEQKELQEIEEDYDNDYFGLCDYSNQIIYLGKDLHIEQKRATLIHELFHCYMSCYVNFEDIT